jgi:hypothetical protein
VILRTPAGNCRRLLLQLAEEDAFDSEKDAASVAYNAAVKGAAKVSMFTYTCTAM